MSPPVVIDGRAAIRRETGGVERVAREMSRRLPALRPDRYELVVPRPRLAHRAGHAWEQLVLPLAARRAELIYCPANLAPLGSRRNVVVIHDLAALAHPEWYGRAYVAWQRLALPAIAGRARLVITVSDFSRAEIAGRLHVEDERIRVVPNGVADGFSPDADPLPAARALGLERPYVLALSTRIARKNVGVLATAAAALGERGIELVTAGSGRSYMRPGEAPPGRPLGYVPGGAVARPVRGRRGAGAAVRLRGLRPAGARGHGERRPGRRREPDGAPGGVRRRRAARGPG